MNNAFNIPILSAGELIDLLTGLYEAAYNNGTLHQIPSVNLIGPMGVGKSSAVGAIARGLSCKTGEAVHVTDIRLLNFSPVDLRGVPTADAAREFTVWLKPRIFDFSEDGLHILFLDEISAAPQSLQAAAYQIALDKRIGEHMLPDNCIVICAGNRTTDKSVAFRMPKALANRMMHFEIQADFESWYSWALKEQLDARVLGYLAFNHSKLNQEAGMEELAFPTPRSWEFVSRLLKTTGQTPEELHLLLAGCIGVSNAGEFEAWCRVYDQLPATADILSGKVVTPVRGTDVIYALIASLQTCVAQRRETITTSQLEHVCGYVSRLPADFASLFFRGLLQLEGMNLKLTKVQAFAAWMKKNKQFL